MMNLKFSFPLLTLCLFLSLAISVSAQYVKGSGPIVTEEFQLDEFKGIGLSIPANVTITQGARQKVVVSAQKDILDNIRKEVKNEYWEISFKKKTKSYDKINIEITVNELNDVALAGSGNIKTTNAFPKVEKFGISISGSGNAALDITAKVIHCSISGSGNATLNGSAQEFKASIAGSGNINGYDMKVEHCKVSTAGSGSVKIHASGEINANLVGSGNVLYKGDPRVDVSVIGSGKVKNVN